MTVKIGVIGLGPCGREAIRALTHEVPGAVVTAVSDADLAVAHGVADVLPSARAQVSGFDLVTSAEVDALVVCSSSRHAVEYVRAATALGKESLVLEPLGLRPSAWRRVLDAELTEGRRLVQVASPRRFDPSYAALRRQVADDLGPVQLVRAGTREADGRAHYLSRLGLQQHRDHDLDAIRWVLGEDLVWAGSVDPHAGTPEEGEEAMLLLQSASGALVNAEAVLDVVTGFDRTGRVHGERGTASLGPVDLRAASAAQMSTWVEHLGSVADPRAAHSWDGLAAAVAYELLGAAHRARTEVPLELGQRPDLYTAR